MLPAGGDEGDALSLLISTATAEAFATLRAAHRFVLIDTPPFRRHAETALLAGRSDGVIVAIARGRHKRDEMREVQLALEGLSVPLTGVILTERESRMRRWLGRSARSGGAPWSRA